MTKDEFDRRLKEESEKLQAKDENSRRFDTLESGLGKLIKEFQTDRDDRGALMEIPMLDENNKPITDDNGRPVYKRVPVSLAQNPQASTDQQFIGVLSNALDKVVDARNQTPPATTGMSDSERKLLQSEARNQILELQNAVTKEVSGLVSETTRIQDRLDSHASGQLSEDARVFISETKERNQNVRYGVDKVGNAFNRLVGIFEGAMQQTPQPAGYDEVPQFTERDMGGAPAVSAYQQRYSHLED